VFSSLPLEPNSAYEKHVFSVLDCTLSWIVLIQGIYLASLVDYCFSQTLLVNGV
jgi:hypothetical protein